MHAHFVCIRHQPNGNECNERTTNIDDNLCVCVTDIDGWGAFNPFHLQYSFLFSPYMLVALIISNSLRVRRSRQQ
jgi:hypothetical protein